MPTAWPATRVITDIYSMKFYDHSIFRGRVGFKQQPIYKTRAFWKDSVLFKKCKNLEIQLKLTLQ